MSKDKKMDSMLPSTLDFLSAGDAGVGHYTAQLREFYDRIEALSSWTKCALQRCSDEDAAFNRAMDAAHAAGHELAQSPHTFLASDRDAASTVRALHAAWLEALATNMETMREMRHMRGAADDHTTRTTLAMHVFLELARLHWLMHRTQMLHEQDVLSRSSAMFVDEKNQPPLDMRYCLSHTKHAMWIDAVNSFSPGTSEDEEIVAQNARVRAMWTYPIMSMTQLQVCTLIMLLTQLLNEVPSAEAVREYRHVMKLTLLRVAQLTSVTHSDRHLDCADMRVALPHAGGGMFAFNRDFGAFVSGYLSEVLCRFFYYDLLVQLPACRVPTLSALASQARAWVHEIVNGFAPEAFSDMYQAIVEEGYTFAGDDAWFRWHHVGKVHSRGACISTLRPHLQRRFFSEDQLNTHSVLASVGTSHVSRLFVFKAVDEYIKMVLPHIHWMNGVVIDSGGIAMSSYALSSNQAPLLLQSFSSYWVYDASEVHACDDVYEALGVWFWLLQERYQTRLYGADMMRFASLVLQQGGLQQDGLQQAGFQPLDLESSTSSRNKKVLQFDF